MTTARWRIPLLVTFLVVLVGFLWYNLSSPLAMYPEEAKALLKAGKFDAVVDVRTDAEWNMGHYPLALHVPLKDIPSVLPQRVPDKNAKILFYCNTTTRSRMAAEQAEQMGYTNVRYLVGTHLNLI